jgi:hypothetical protein
MELKMGKAYSHVARRLLATGAVGVSMGLAAVAITPSNQSAQATTAENSQQSFAARLNSVQSAVPADASSTVSGKKKTIRVAQFRNID